MNGKNNQIIKENLNGKMIKWLSNEDIEKVSNEWINVPKG